MGAFCPEIFEVVIIADEKFMRLCRHLIDVQDVSVEGVELSVFVAAGQFTLQTVECVPANVSR